MKPLKDTLNLTVTTSFRLKQRLQILFGFAVLTEVQCEVEVNPLAKKQKGELTFIYKPLGAVTRVGRLLNHPQIPVQGPTV